jgi:hypothetical protein
MRMWTSQKARQKFRLGLVRQISKGYLCGLCVYFSRGYDWGWCHNFMSEWHNEHIHEEFSCECFLISPEFVSYRRNHPIECSGACKL